MSGATGPAGSIGATGPQGPIGLTGPQGANGQNASRITIVGFNNSTTWTCPSGVYEIAVELWGGSGGGTFTQAGGDGGYNRAVLTVSPGVDYSIAIGQSGAAGSGTNNGGNGGVSAFGGILNAQGGGGGIYGVWGGTGSNGAIQNWPYGFGYPSYYDNGRTIGTAPGGNGGTNFTPGKVGFCLITY
jgi:hypothetical protein